MRKIERFLEYLGHKEITENAATVQCGLAQSTIHQAKTGKCDLGMKSIDKILNAYQDLDKNWLLSGEGSMLKSDAPVKSFTSGVPYYNVDFLGGFDLLPDDQTTRPEYLIDFKAYDRATCWCNISGHSMEPEISSGDIIALREVPDPTFLPFGEVYAIVTTTGMRTVKRIGPGKDSETYSLIPTNKSPEFGVQEIPKEMIARVFEVLGCMKKL